MNETFYKLDTIQKKRDGLYCIAHVFTSVGESAVCKYDTSEHIKKGEAEVGGDEAARRSFCLFVCHTVQKNSPHKNNGGKKPKTTQKATGAQRAKVKKKKKWRENLRIHLTDWVTRWNE